MPASKQDIRVEAGNFKRICGNSHFQGAVMGSAPGSGQQGPRAKSYRVPRR